MSARWADRSGDRTPRRPRGGGRRARLRQQAQMARQARLRWLRIAVRSVTVSSASPIERRMRSRVASLAASASCLSRKDEAGQSPWTSCFEAGQGVFEAGQGRYKDVFIPIMFSGKSGLSDESQGREHADRALAVCSHTCKPRRMKQDAAQHNPDRPRIRSRVRPARRSEAAVELPEQIDASLYFHRAHPHPVEAPRRLPQERK